MRNSIRVAWAALVGGAAALTVASVGFAGSFATAADACGTQPCTWNFTQAKVPSAQPLGKHGAGVTVAVVDTWVDHTHPEFGSRLIGHAYCVDGDGRCRANTRSPDRCDHGTHVAGTVASTRYGVASKAKLLAVQVLSYDQSSGSCSGSVEDVVAGIRYATASGAQVINLSLGALVAGLFQSSAVTTAVREAASAGAVVVFAAGNSTAPLSDDYGADAVLVAATGPNGSLAPYSSRGGAIDLAAPGGDDGSAGLGACTRSTCILSTVPGGKYQLREGTSMAAPHVSGTAALLLAQNPTRGRGDVIASLRDTARPVAGVRHGLIDATAALRLQAPAPTRISSTAGPAATAPAPPTTRGSARLGSTPRISASVGPYATDLFSTATATPPRKTVVDTTSEGSTRADPRDPSSGAQPPGDIEGFPLPALLATAAVIGLVGVAAAAAYSSARRRAR